MTPTMVTRWWRWMNRAQPVQYLVAAAVTAVAGLGTYWAGAGLSSPHDQFDLKIYYRAVKYWVDGGDLYSYAQPDSLMGSLGFTYPPLSAVLMAPMATLAWESVQVITVCAIAIAAFIMMGLMLQDSVLLKGARGLMIVGVATAAGFLFEPVRQTIAYGQVNIFLGLLVIFDLLFLARKAPRWVGVGIGLAAAIKLTPAIFIVYLVVTKRWRAAIVACITAAVASLAAAFFAPHEVWEFFTKTLWDTSRVGHPDSVFNQSINGLLARIASPDEPSKPLWALLIVLVAGFGFWRARKLYLAGDDLAGLTVTGIVGLMMSPVSWTHHAIWVLPALIVLIHRAVELWRDVSAGSAGLRGQAYLMTALAIIAFGWLVEPHHYVQDRTRDWSGADWWQQTMATFPTIWMLAVIVLLPARQHVPASWLPAPSTRAISLTK